MDIGARALYYNRQWQSLFDGRGGLGGNGQEGGQKSNYEWSEAMSHFAEQLICIDSGTFTGERASDKSTTRGRNKTPGSSFRNCQCVETVIEE